MKEIVLLGAGRSASILIEYLLKVCEERSWNLTVGDRDVELVKEKLNGHQRATPIQFDIEDEKALADLTSQGDLIISMLPAIFHLKVAESCLANGTNLLTASYMTSEMREMHQEATEKGIIMLHECGLDPGIDHMSAMKVIDEIRDQGGLIKGFESFTGGLLAPSNEDNPWHYKFTWNPRNVVLAGTGGVKFLQEGKFKYIPYHRLFRRTEIIHIKDHGYFEGYANRDSLKYREVYGLGDIETMYRGTLRRTGFCKAWNVFVQIGATDDSYEMEGVSTMTHREFMNSFLSYNPHDSVELKLAHYLNLDLDADEMHKLNWLGMFSNDPVGLEKGTPAQILEHILKKKWTMKPDEADQIVMWHKFNYDLKGEEQEIHATLVTTGTDQTNTAMARTVGLPLGIAAKLILDGTIGLKGAYAPIVKEIYEPVLDELINDFGFEFTETQVSH